MDDLVKFLRARFDEADEHLDAIDHVQAPAGRMAQERRDIEAKRRIVDEHNDQHECTDGRASEYPYVGCQTLRLLALPFDGHPDYLPKWKP